MKFMLCVHRWSCYDTERPYDICHLPKADNVCIGRTTDAPRDGPTNAKREARPAFALLSLLF
jgi:hypothetical protein